MRSPVDPLLRRAGNLGREAATRQQCRLAGGPVAFGARTTNIGGWSRPHGNRCRRQGEDWQAARRRHGGDWGWGHILLVHTEYNMIRLCQVIVYVVVYQLIGWLIRTRV
jgi:hypothetical protein